jgi:perosamine synthetase
MAAFSFYGNKIIATGEGGMVVTDDDRLARRAAQLRGQGQDFERRYWFPIVGYNYRMMNLQSAIGLAQLECADWHMRRRAEIAAWYLEELQDVPGITWQAAQEWADPAHWLFTVILNDDIKGSRDAVMSALERRGIETRPVFYPMHVLPPYREAARGGVYPVAERLAQRGLSLPTWAGLEREDISFVCHALHECLHDMQPL